nr:unnamed protein product [Digitaria exilis]
MDAATKKAYVTAILVQVILTGMSVISKAAFDAGMSTFIFVFYRQASGSILMLPLALFLQRMEVVKLSSASGVAKLTGVALCLAGVFAIAFYSGPALSPVNHHRAFSAHAPGSGRANASLNSKTTWVEGTFLMILANMAWSLSIVWQAALLKELPNRMLVATALCVFSAAQSFVVAVAAVRDFSRWRLRPDVSLLAVVYAGFVVTGVTYYLQAWCVEMKGPVFFAVWTPLCFVLTMFCSSFFLGEIVHLGSVLWGKNKESSSKAASRSQVNMTDFAQDEEERENPNSYEAASASTGEQV